MTDSTKKGFDFARNSIYVADPIDLAIIGGKVLAKDERGPLDTADGPEHDLWDPRVQEELSEEFIANVDAFGVKTPITITKIGDLAVVTTGRRRVRAARVANIRRKLRGEPPIKVDCKVERARGSGLMAAMILENEARKDDSVIAKIEKFKRLLARGVSVEDAAVAFCVSVSTAKGWIAFDDNATAETKAAVAEGRVSATAAAELARAKDPEKQRAALATALTMTKKGGKAPTVQDARRAVGAKTRAADKGDGVGIPGKREQRGMLDELVRRVKEAETKGHATVAGRSMEWWAGVEATLKMIIGEGAPVAALRDLLADVEA